MGATAPQEPVGCRLVGAQRSGGGRWFWEVTGWQGGYLWGGGWWTESGGCRQPPRPAPAPSPQLPASALAPWFPVDGLGLVGASAPPIAARLSATVTVMWTAGAELGGGAAGGGGEAPHWATRPLPDRITTCESDPLLRSCGPPTLGNPTAAWPATVLTPAVDARRPRPASAALAGSPSPGALPPCSFPWTGQPPSPPPPPRPLLSSPPFLPSSPASLPPVAS